MGDFDMILRHHYLTLIRRVLPLGACAVVVAQLGDSGLSQGWSSRRVEVAGTVDFSMPGNPARLLAVFTRGLNRQGVPTRLAAWTEISLLKVKRLV